MRLPVALIAAASLTTLFVPNAARALTWNWSVTGTTQSAQGTFTTAGATAQAGITETITGITGTYIRSTTGVDDGTYTITGLSSYLGALNTFQWDGSNTSSLSVANEGISFTTNSPIKLNILDGNSNFGPASDVLSSINGDDDGIITSSTLVPQAAPQGVPGPLPLLGAGAAFGWSRRLRRRLKTGSVPATASFKTASLPSVLSPLA